MGQKDFLYEVCNEIERDQFAIPIPEEGEGSGALHFARANFWRVV